ncbi:unnamed protein product [Ambrosiozyma monospora]|uniref:Actin-related protein 2/3 complex subunit 5 n=1 Tax=Ambrosiozyma monospora TaxID=43982 RepID=A0A9W6Z2H3_AMBMO|nr:unnamed protein product [Ambrosiozyma monospora]
MEQDWRRIDVDAYDPDQQYQPDPIDVPVYTLQALEPKLQQIRGLLSRGSALDSLRLAIDSPPYADEPSVKKQYLLGVLEVLNNIKQTEINGVIKQLSLDEIDVLIKFVYSLMALKEGQKSGGVLLGWFDKTIEAVGEGPIVRYLSDPLKL